MRPQRTWTNREIARLKELAPYCPVSVVAAELGRSQDSVRMKAKTSGISFRNGKVGRLKDWSQAEEATLRELAPTKTSAEIAAVLGMTPQAVRTYASKNGIRIRGNKYGPCKEYWNTVENDPWRHV